MTWKASGRLPFVWGCPGGENMWSTWHCIHGIQATQEQSLMTDTHTCMHTHTLIYLFQIAFSLSHTHSHARTHTNARTQTRIPSVNWKEKQNKMSMLLHCSWKIWIILSCFIMICKSLTGMGATHWKPSGVHSQCSLPQPQPQQQSQPLGSWRGLGGWCLDPGLQTQWRRWESPAMLDISMLNLIVTYCTAVKIIIIFHSVITKCGKRHLFTGM